MNEHLHEQEQEETTILYPEWENAISFFPEFSDEKRYIYGIFDSQTHEILYIGQATNIHSRLSSHTHLDNTRYSKYFVVNREKVDEIEFELILKYLPPLNNALPTNQKYITIEKFQSTDIRFYSKKVKVLRLLEKHGFENFYGYFLFDDLHFVSTLLDEEAGND